MKKNICYAVATVLCSLAWHTAGAQDMNYYNVSIEPKTNDNFKVAEFRLWCPADMNPDGVLAVFTGFNGDGRAMAEDPVWQSFAREHNLALMAYHMVAIWPAGIIRQHLEDHYTHVARGSGEAFWLALEKLGAQAGRPEIKNLPVAAWGHSAGGQFAYGLACQYPERIIGFVSVKGGFYYMTTTAETRRMVPGLLLAGGKDESFRQEAIQKLFETNRAQGALWCRALESDAGHGVEKCNVLAKPWLSAIIRARLQPDLPLAVLREEDGWLGDLVTGTISPTREFIGVREAAVWLPDEKAARIWSGFHGAKTEKKSPDK